MKITEIGADGRMVEDLLVEDLLDEALIKEAFAGRNRTAAQLEQGKGCALRLPAPGRQQFGCSTSPVAVSHWTTASTS